MLDFGELIKNPALIIPLTGLVSVLTSWQLTQLILRRKALVSMRDDEDSQMREVPIFSQTFVNKFEEHRSTLYRLVQTMQAVTGRLELLERKVEQQNEKHQILREEFVDIRGQLRAIKDVVDELRRQLELFREPIAEVAAWIHRRRQGGPLTPP